MSDAAKIYHTTATLPADRQLLARLHLGLHAKGHKLAIDWLIMNGTPRVDDLEAGHVLDGTLFALAEVHEVVAKDPDVAPMLAFRAALLAASLVAQLGLFEVATASLNVALLRARDWAASCLARAQAGSGEAVPRVDAEGFIDACLRETAMLDASLGDACREWTLEVGRVLSAPVRLGAASSPYLTIAHSAAFKGAVTARLLADPGPAPVQPEIGQVLHELQRMLDANDAPRQPPPSPWSSKPSIPRIALSPEEAATALGMSLNSFERHVQPELRLIRRGELRLVPLVELERWAIENAEH